MLERIAGLWFWVLDASALAAAGLTTRLSTRRRLSAVVEDNGDLVLFPEGRVTGPALGRLLQSDRSTAPRTARLLRRSHVALALDPRDFVFRSIDLPGRATEFIEPIVRTQIDRLTPWRPEQVLFGCSQPTPRGPEGSVAVTVAATDRALVTPLIDRIQAFGTAVIVARVALPTALAPAEGEKLVVLRSTAAAFAAAPWRRAIGILTAAVVTLVIASSLYGQIAGMRLAAEASDLEREAASKRAALAKAIADADPSAGPRQVVEQRKHVAPYATLVLDAVSRLLPDNTFVTSFDITGTRLQLVGFTANAPALIRLFEGSPLFTSASFFAPTTRLPDDPADRFNIEATIRPEAFAR